MHRAPPSTAQRIPTATPGEPLELHDAALERAVAHLASLQRDDGSWEAEMVWNTMLLSQYVIVGHATGQLALSERERSQILKHYSVTQLPDGSWPIHIESDGYLFFTTLAYVALRMLGVEPEDPMAAKARAWIHARDVRAIPTWGKFWLSNLGLYDYAGMNPVPPELFLLPKSL